MQGDLIPKLVSPGHLNKLRTADRQQSEQIQSFMSASSLAGRASTNRSMIISDFVTEVAQGKLILKLHFIFGWKSNEQIPVMQLCCSRSRGFAAVPSLEEYYCLR